MLNSYNLLQIIIFFVSILEINSEGCENKKIFCHAPIWFNFFGNQVNPFFCTHISVDYLETNPNNNWEIFLPIPQARSSRLESILKLKSINPKIELLASIGGWADIEQPEKYYALTSETEMDKFTKNAIATIQKYDLDGLNFVWNYLGRHGNFQKDIETLALITKSLCDKTSSNGYFCMVSLIASTDIERATNRDEYFKSLATIIKSADYVNLWTGDIGSGVNTVFHTSMLTSEKIPQKSIEGILNFFTETAELKLSKTDIEKFLLLIPTQSNGYKFLNQQNKIPDFGEAYGWDVVQHGRTQAEYDDLCKELNSGNGFKIEYDGEAPFFVSADRTEYVPYNTVEYVRKKVKYAVDRGLGGIDLFYLAGDDYTGACANMSYPILSTIFKELEKCSDK